MRLASQGGIPAGIGDRPIDVVRGKIGADPLAYLPVFDVCPNCDDLSCTVRGWYYFGYRASAQGDVSHFSAYEII